MHRAAPDELDIRQGIGWRHASRMTSTNDRNGNVMNFSFDAGNRKTGETWIVSGNSVMVPPKAGTYGTMGRNIFRDAGFKNVDFSVFKTFSFKERYNTTFPGRVFQLL